MPNGHIPILGPPSKVDKLGGIVTQLIDFTLALAAMNIERGTFNQEQLFRMESIIKDARRKLGSAFTIEEGMKAVRAAFRIELGKEGGKDA